MSTKCFLISVWKFLLLAKSNSKMSQENPGPIVETINHLLSFALVFVVIGALLFVMKESGRYLLGIKPKTNLLGTKKKRKK